MLPQDVTPADPVVQRMETTIPVALGRDVQAALELSRFGEAFRLAVALSNGVVGSCDHALTLTSSHDRDQSRVPSLDPDLFGMSPVL